MSPDPTRPDCLDVGRMLRETDPDRAVTPGAAEPLANMIDPFRAGQAYRCNFDDRTPAGQALAMRMVNGADMSSDDVIGQEIAIVAAMLQPVELMSEETGELRWCPRIVLLLDDDTTVGFVSNGIAKSLQLLSQFRGSGPWEPPIRVKVRQVKTRAARRTFVLDLVAPDPPVKPSEGK